MSANLLLSLVNDTLDYGMLAAGKFTLNFEQVKISELVNDVLKMILVQLMQKKDVQLNYWIEPGVPETFLTDYMRLKQVLINLLRNSVKFTFQGSINLLIRKIKMTTKKMRKTSNGLSTLEA
jgi:signal transduction histidine kinase